MRITAVVNQKGGVGKTASTVNLGGALAENGRRVLLVDLDPQGHLTDALQVPESTPPVTLADALLGNCDPAEPDLLQRHSDGATLIPTTIHMFTVGKALQPERAREERLKRVLTPLAPHFDDCLIDCPPALDTLTDNALAAADGVVIPVQLEDSSLRALRLLLAQIDAIEAELRTDRLTLHGLLVSMLERGAGGTPRSLVGRSVLASFQELPIPIIASVPRGIVITEAWRVGQPVTTYAPDSEHAQVYRSLATALNKGEL